MDHTRARDPANDLPRHVGILPGWSWIHNHHILHVEIISQAYKSAGVLCDFREHIDERGDNNIEGWDTSGSEQRFVSGAGDDYTVGNTCGCVVRMLEPFPTIPETIEVGKLTEGIVVSGNGLERISHRVQEENYTATKVP